MSSSVWVQNTLLYSSGFRESKIIILDRILNYLKRLFLEKVWAFFSKLPRGFSSSVAPFAPSKNFFWKFIRNFYRDSSRVCFWVCFRSFLWFFFANKSFNNQDSFYFFPEIPSKIPLLRIPFVFWQEFPHKFIQGFYHWLNSSSIFFLVDSSSNLFWFLQKFLFFFSRRFSRGFLKFVQRLFQISHIKFIQK